MQNGKEFMKVMDGTHALSVLISDSFVRQMYTKNKIFIADYLSDEVAMPSSEKEFEAAARKAKQVTQQFYHVKKY
jgi:hypothetical protein